ncbi:hypothetical protein CYY_010237 [Polysphondylium violaceum]|uniref:PH domain-containing protein n=1 Tax=Polysphondylium violaceum TaxID=133409 RepID=A0A8J4PLN9_9MYCE|nr:hypothetical protein CYY_010237 [Polysphondylium violaceum]
MTMNFSLDKSVKSGNLYKKGKFNKSWQKRWCILARDSKLYYHKTPSEKHCGYVELTQTIIKQSDMIERENVFEIITGDRIFLFCAETKSEMDDWMRKLNTHSTVYKANEIMERAEFIIREQSLKKSFVEDEFLKFRQTIPSDSQDLLSSPSFFDTYHSLDLISFSFNNNNNGNNNSNGSNNNSNSSSSSIGNSKSNSFNNNLTSSNGNMTTVTTSSTLPAKFNYQANYSNISNSSSTEDTVFLKYSHSNELLKTILKDHHQPPLINNQVFQASNSTSVNNNSNNLDDSDD